MVPESRFRPAQKVKLLVEFILKVKLLVEFKLKKNNKINHLEKFDPKKVKKKCHPILLQNRKLLCVAEEDHIWA